MGDTDVTDATEDIASIDQKAETRLEQEIQASTRNIVGLVSSPSLFRKSHVADVTELLDNLNSEELTALRAHFYEKKVDERIKEPKGSAHPRFRGFKLNKDEFLTAIQSVMATSQYNDAADDLFELLVKDNAEEHTGYLWWEQLLDELMDFMSEKTKSRPGDIVKESFCSLHAMSHCRRETIVRVVVVETAKSFCFVVVSKYGKVGIYDWNMSLLEQYEVRLSTQIATTAGGEVRRTTWVVDAVYMSDAATLLVAASDRSLHFYSMSGLVCVPVYRISGLPNTPTCLHYTPGVADGVSMLLVGDDQGSIATVYFHQPQYALFKRTSNDSFDEYFWKELSSQKAWVTITMDQGIHKDEIHRVEYFSDNNTVVSCSNDPNTTVIIRYIVGRRAPYVFKITRGVRCFHLDRSLRLLATGGKDSVVRLWNPIMPKKPVASLFGHKTCIVDVRILRHLSVLISISKETVVKVWDLVKHTCMQSLPLLFPVHGALARTPEFGVQSFYPGPVTCKPPYVMPRKSSTEFVFSPRTVTTASSSGLESSIHTVDSRWLEKLDSKSDNSNGMSSTHTANTSNSKQDTESVKTTTSGLYRFPTLASIGQGSGRHETRTDTRFTNATERSDATTSCVESSWTRMELLAVSCNYVVILQLSERDLEEKEDRRVGNPLDPPLRNQDAVAPSPWLTVDDAYLTGLTDIDDLKPSGELDVPPAILATLQKSLGNEMTRDLASVAASCYNRDSQQTDLKQIRAMVDQCAPHLALGTTELEDIPFTIPVTVVHHTRRRRKEKEVRARETKVTRASMTMDESETSTVLDTTTTNTTSTSTNRSDKY